MKSMLLRSVYDLRKDQQPLEFVEMPIPEPMEKEVLIKVSACGVCHTELDEIEGRTKPEFYPIIPGHQVIGTIVRFGGNSGKFRIGERVGVAWIYSSCGKCQWCISGNENLCPDFRATGRDRHGGYAEYMTAHEDFIHGIPDNFSDEEAAPLLCAGAIGYRSLKLAFNMANFTGRIDEKKINTLGLTGFGASAHLVLKMAMFRFPWLKVFVFARNKPERDFALELGAVWSGDTTDSPAEKLDAIIDTTPVWKPVVEALKNLKPGGRLVINAIRKENYDKDYLLNLDYPSHLWMEKEIKSVANVALNDVRDFLQLAAEMKIKPEIEIYKLEEANRALIELKQQKIRGAKVLKIG